MRRRSDVAGKHPIRRNALASYQPQRASVRFEAERTLRRLPRFQPGASARAADGALGNGGIVVAARLGHGVMVRGL